MDKPNYPRLVIVDETHTSEKLVVPESRLVNTLNNIGGLIWNGPTPGLGDHAFELHSGYDWYLVEDQYGRVVLLPLEK